MGVKAPAPAVATTTPFGPRIHALAIYLKSFQALSYERLRLLFRDAFGLVISEGALMNMFIRSHAGFKLEADKAKGVLRAARVVASDETGVRIEGTNSYHWVFHCKDAVVHQPDYSRAARVVEETMSGHVPQVWLSDRYSAQQNHGGAHQTCLAHLARDTAFALEHGSDDLPLRFKLWFGRAFDAGQEIASLKHRRSPAKSGSWKNNSRRFSPRRQDAISHATCRPKSPGAKPASNLLRFSRRGRCHEWLRTETAALRDPAKSDQRLSRHVGRTGRGRRANDRRHRKAQGRKPLRPSSTSWPETPKKRPKNGGG